MNQGLFKLGLFSSKALEKISLDVELVPAPLYFTLRKLKCESDHGMESEVYKRHNLRRPTFHLLTPLWEEHWNSVGVRFRFPNSIDCSPDSNKRSKYSSQHVMWCKLDIILVSIIEFLLLILSPKIMSALHWLTRSRDKKHKCFVEFDAGVNC